jgi:hypothetical protein
MIFFIKTKYSSKKLFLYCNDIFFWWRVKFVHTNSYVYMRASNVLRWKEYISIDIWLDTHIGRSFNWYQHFIMHIRDGEFQKQAKMAYSVKKKEETKRRNKKMHFLFCWIFTHNKSSVCTFLLVMIMATGSVSLCKRTYRFKDNSILFTCLLTNYRFCPLFFKGDKPIIMRLYYTCGSLNEEQIILKDQSFACCPHKT